MENEKNSIQKQKTKKNKNTQTTKVYKQPKKKENGEKINHQQDENQKQPVDLQDEN